MPHALLISPRKNWVQTLLCLAIAVTLFKVSVFQVKYDFTNATNSIDIPINDLHHITNATNDSLRGNVVKNQKETERIDKDVERETGTTRKDKEAEKNEKSHNDMTIIILSMDRFDSLRRLLRSIIAAEYPKNSSDTDRSPFWVGREHKIDLVIRFDRPSKYDANNGTSDNIDNNSVDLSSEEQGWKNEIHSISEWIENEWQHGTTSVTISDTNIGLAQSWFSAWEPKTKFDRAVIFEDDVEVSPLYYKWLSASHDHYGYGYHTNEQDGGASVDKLAIDEYGYDSDGQFHKPRPKIPDLASFGLSRQTLVPLRKFYKKSKSNARMFPVDQPFMYALLGSHGFSPLAHVWMEFLEFVKCSSNRKAFVGGCWTEGEKNKKIPIVNNAVDIHIPELVTSDWYKKKKRQMWTQHFVYFCYEKQLYNLYRNTLPSENKAFVTHWKEKGAHFDGKHATKDNIQPLLQIKDIEGNAHGGPSVMDFPPSSTLKRYDFGANLVRMVGHLDPSKAILHSSSIFQGNLPPVVMSVALGYSLEHFETFVETLRNFYFHDVWLLIDGRNDGAGPEENSEATQIRRYLQNFNIKYLETDATSSGHVKKGKDWEKINRDRFQFFSTICDPKTYSLCLTTDFRDSIFQSNPFANIDRLLLLDQQSTNRNATAPSGILHVFEHNKEFLGWHIDLMKRPGCNLYNNYHEFVEGKNIINGGSMIGSPLAFQRLKVYMTEKWKGCNDQVILNVLVRSKILAANSTEDEVAEKLVVKVYGQGHGPLNVIGHGGMILKNKQGLILNRNCIVAPAVHQYDRVVCPGD